MVLNVTGEGRRDGCLAVKGVKRGKGATLRHPIRKVTGR